MKKITLLILFAFFSFTNHSIAQTTAIPDANFEQALIDLGLDSDGTVNGQVLTADINTVTSLDVSNRNIVDMGGLEGFSALQILNCSNNDIFFIDAELNPQLRVFNAANNDINGIALDFNSFLEDVDLSGNGITFLNFTSLANISTITLNNMPNLNTVKLKNGNNVGITSISVLNTPNLDCIEVDDPIYSETNWTNVDPQISFSTICLLDPFITTWQTTTTNESITIPTFGGGYLYDIDWGDGIIEEDRTGNATHTFATPGTYTIRIAGPFPRIYFNNLGDKDKILSIEEWGSIRWASMGNAFYGCSNLVINATDAPDLSFTVDLGGMFWLGQSITGGVAHWDVSRATNMTDMFNGAINFNEDISGWNVSNVTHMDGMFNGASSFNQDLNTWNTTSIRFTRFMFNNATSFNGDISTWNVGTLVEMDAMFMGATSFNQDIGGWDTSSMRETDRSFSGATSFNQDIGSWDVSDVFEMHEMFDGATAFNQSLADWDVGDVATMDNMLRGTAISTANYDKTLIGWNTLPSLQSGVTLDVNAVYCASATARQNIINTYNWTINDNGQVNTCTSDKFITTWQTTTANESITIPTTGSGYNYSIDWGDGTIDTVINANATHTYAVAGTYTVAIDGDFPRIFFDNTGDKDKILSIEQWGAIQWSNFSDAFEGCSNLQLNATDTPDLSGVDTLSRMFRDCIILNADLNNWDTSNIRFLNAMFDGATNFNGNISSWDTSSVISMPNVFRNAINFNQDISNWNTTNVQNMVSMFQNARTFNQPIGNWDVSKVTVMRLMFKDAIVFNQNISNWNTANVQNMASMFQNATAFDQPIGNWDVSAVTTINNMFNLAISFNQPLNNWNISSVTNLSSMFNGATLFNQPLDNWNVSNVTIMSALFRNTTFDQSLATWDVSNVTNMFNMFLGSKLSTPNYDATLIAWNDLPILEDSVIFNAGNSQYCQGELARANIISTYNWTILDGDLDLSPPMAICKNITVALDVNGQATIVASDIDDGSSSNCGSVSLSIDIDTFTCADIGDNQVTLTVTDDTIGNTSTCVATVTVIDNTAPVALCQDLTVQLDAAGFATIDPLNVDAGSSDACGIASYELDMDAFTCSNLGANIVTLTVTDVSGNSGTCTATITVEENPTNNCYVELAPIVYLQGASLDPNTGEETLMRDDLRVAGLLSTTSPYADALNCSPVVFITTGNDAIVDWIWVEIRDANDNANIIQGRSALLQRDGNIVDVDGASPLVFTQLAGNYHIAIKHRNHLGIITNSTVALSSTAISANFSDANNPITFGVAAQTSFGMPTDTLGMWAGNANDDSEIIFLNTGAESVDIKQLVLDVSAIESPFGASVFYKPQGYYTEDVNMDGEVIFLNAGNELLTIKDNILAHPNNAIFNSVFFIIQEQLP